MIAPADLEHCERAIRHGSLSFHAASKLLPSKVRDPALALYAFCRLADDAVDLHQDKGGAVLSLNERLEKCYSGTPRNAPADRAFAAIIEDFEMPRELPEALLEGLAWDAVERRYQTLSGVYSYSARVASAVGAMMCVLMRVRDPDALARACDLGVAMQLTNIARDVGEDARAGRVYLPLDWLDAAGIDLELFLRDPLPTDPLRGVVRKLLNAADRLYMRAEAGIGALPRGSRLGIYAASYIYAGIGREVRRAGCDSISTRAHTSKAQKMGWISQAALATGATMILPKSAVIHAAPLPEVSFLVDAAARRDATRGAWGDGRAGDLVGIFATLKAQDAQRRMLEP